jgi:hypothetical protein
VQVSGWVQGIDPSRYVYTPGSTTQFSDLTTSGLQGVGDSSDNFDSLLNALLGSFPPSGTPVPGLDDALSQLESAAADLNTDDFSPILDDLSNLGMGVNASMAALSLLSDFGVSALGDIMPWLDGLASDILGLLGFEKATITVVDDIGTFVNQLAVDVQALMGGGGAAGILSPPEYNIPPSED